MDDGRCKILTVAVRVTVTESVISQLSLPKSPKVALSPQPALQPRRPSFNALTAPQPSQLTALTAHSPHSRWLVADCCLLCVVVFGFGLSSVFLCLSFCLSVFLLKAGGRQSLIQLHICERAKRCRRIVKAARCSELLPKCGICRHLHRRRRKIKKAEARRREGGTYVCDELTNVVTSA